MQKSMIRIGSTAIWQ